ncbi:sigma-E factor regulatory protein RseA [Aeromonas encheleia]|jgi:sigma-E factor negative regulatory protein RseA|uniref:RseA family anti-sigma factor n=1 Tax=Aeromonas TaxID=642 RepID=UPI0005B23372|nr:MULTISPECIES: RseA family anti-sigma factor [Aeromonas]MBV7415278.1 transcriptional regulator [Aeromonas sp. sif2433]MBV7437988.1 transcriptional regulator [Aeromonas sp. sif2416]MBV7598425.1 transcriptional regulator [Aeromonas sp. sia0103]UNP89026.1 RseA family anti-sigma factor [Aeromonas encheleia]VEG97968.1 sigma-E factor regulatory protein RseA [Aeromonas encheleia]
MANQEQLSALMDGDLSDVEVLNELGTDPALQDTWARYHLIGDAMRGDLPVNLQLDLSDSIMLALEDEPTILAPKPVQPAAPQVHRAKVLPLLRRVSQQVGQYAIAASVAAAVIFGVQQYQGQDGMPANPVLNTIPVGGSATPVSVHYPQDGNRATTRQQGLNEQQMQEQRERINAFLRDHQLQQRLLQDKQIQE